MKQKRKLIILLVAAYALLSGSMTALASALTEAEVEAQVASQGKEAVTGNVFIWFLCAVAFLKISQKIDSFMASLGVNVGNTGGNMLAELMLAGRTLAGSFSGHGGGGGHKKSPSHGSAAVEGGLLSGGLAGSVSRQAERSAVNSLTSHTDSGGFGNMLYQSSLKKGGDFANQVIGDIAKGDYGKVGSIKGKDASQAFESYMGLNSSQHNTGHSNSSNKENASYNAHQTVNPPGNGQAGKKPGNGQATKKPLMPAYTDMEIGGGRITGIEQTKDGKREFAMYHADQYMKPQKGDFETVKSVDGASWYKQYAQAAVDKKPYQAKDGKIAYQESMVQKLPPSPPRKGKV